MCADVSAARGVWYFTITCHIIIFIIYQSQNFRSIIIIVEISVVSAVHGVDTAMLITGNLL